MFKFLEGVLVKQRFNRLWKPADSVPHGSGFTVRANPSGWWYGKEYMYLEVDNIKPYELYLVVGTDKRVFAHILQNRYLAIRILGEPLQIYGFGHAKGTERIFKGVREEYVKSQPYYTEDITYI